MELGRTRPDSIDLSTKSVVDTTILKIPKERDSLHKFAISKMLGISEEEEEEEEDRPRPPKRTRLDPEIKKVDENCNNVANAGKIHNKRTILVSNDVTIKVPGRLVYCNSYAMILNNFMKFMFIKI